MQERCDYDLVMPLALLFYSAVLYVSAEVAALVPNSGCGFGWNFPACSHQFIPRRKVLYESRGIGIEQPLHKLRDKENELQGFGSCFVFFFFKAGLIRKGDGQ